MRIGLPREVKSGERRVALTPDAVATLAGAGHAVRVQAGAGLGAGFADAAYAAAGAAIVEGAREAYEADLVVKVKELQDTEWRHVQPDSILLGFLLLAYQRNIVHELRARRVYAIAAESIVDASGRLPVLAPMSRISGALAIGIGAHWLMHPHGPRGVDIADARVVVLGAGSAGTAAAIRAHALGANVSVLSRVGPRLAALAHRFGLDARTMAMQPEALMDALDGADLVIGAINVQGGATPKLIDREHLRSMGEGAVLIDISIDGGGVADTSRETDFDAPTYIEEGVIHYAVPNMPSAVPRSATLAYSAALLPHVMALAEHGARSALQRDDGLAAGAQLFGGQVVARMLADSLSTEPRSLTELLADP
ncbi:MAG: alanine dehydrogenase [Betaproteobacteria bacterium]|nr:alanine dehydrogenase [Betaproteobacteria bacterium]